MKPLRFIFANIPKSIRWIIVTGIVVPVFGYVIVQFSTSQTINLSTKNISSLLFFILFLLLIGFIFGSIRSINKLLAENTQLRNIEAERIDSHERELKSRQYEIIIDLYRKMFDGKENFKKLWNRSLTNSEAEVHLQELRNLQILVFSNQILIDDEMLEHFKNIIGGMIEISNSIRTNEQIKAEQTKELREEEKALTSLIKKKFSIEKIPPNLLQTMDKKNSN